MSWETLENQIRECTDCPLHETNLNRLVGQGNPEADFMLIDYAPTGKDIYRKRLFQSKTGTWFLNLLADAGFRKGDLYMTTLLKCSYRESLPDPSCVDFCREYLMRQIELVNPLVIITLGETVLKALLPIKKKLSTVRGDEIKALDRIIIPTYHPSWVLSQQKKLREDELYKDLWRAYETIYPPTKRTKRKKRIPLSYE